MQVQATTSAYAASILRAGTAAEQEVGWGWFNANCLQPTCNLPIGALGLSKKVLLCNTIQISGVINNAQQHHQISQHSHQHRLIFVCKRSSAVGPVHDSCQQPSVVCVPLVTKGQPCFTSGCSSQHVYTASRRFLCLAQAILFNERFIC